MLTLVSSLGALAGQVTVDFSGTVTFVDASKISGTKVGDSYSGTLVYDSNTTKTSLPGADPAMYTALPPLASGLGITLNVGGTTYAAEAGYAEQLMVGYHLGGPFLTCLPHGVRERGWGCNDSDLRCCRPDGDGVFLDGAADKPGLEQVQRG